MNGANYIGPWGGGGGQEFDLYEPARSLPANYVLYTPAIRSASWLDAMAAVYWDKDHTQAVIYSPYVGGTGGALNNEPPLRIGEYIVGASGRTGNYVDQLTLITNLGFKLNFGGTGGVAQFSYSVDNPTEEEIIGFFGRAHTYIDAIGFVVRKRQ